MSKDQDFGNFEFTHALTFRFLFSVCGGIKLFQKMCLGISMCCKYIGAGIQHKVQVGMEDSDQPAYLHTIRKVQHNSRIESSLGHM